MTWKEEIRKNDLNEMTRNLRTKDGLPFLTDEVKEAMKEIQLQVTQAFERIDIEALSNVLMPYGKYANIDEFAAAISQKGVESLKRKYKIILGKPSYMRDR